MEDPELIEPILEEIEESEPAWKSEPIIRVADDSYTVIHNGNPYSVCPKDVDPLGLFDLEEVAGYWDSLPEDDSRKQIYAEPSPPEDNRTPAERREDAYRIEADSILEQYQFYHAKSEGFRLLKQSQKADEETEKANEYLRQYALKTDEIRERYPDEETKEE